MEHRGTAFTAYNTCAPARLQSRTEHDNNVALTAGLNKYSARITQPKYQGASQAMLYATGLKPEDMHKPQASTRACCFWLAIRSLYLPLVAYPCMSWYVSFW